MEEGYKIILAKSPKDDPVLKYRKEVHRKVEQGKGKLSSFAERLLVNKQNEWGISAEIAKQIRDEVLQPYREYERKLAEYELALRDSVTAGEIQYPLSPNIEADLQEYRQHLKLKESDITAIENKILLPLKIQYEKSLEEDLFEISVEDEEFLETEEDSFEQYEESLNHQILTETLLGGITLEMIKIPAGSYLMGSNESDSEKPQHQVNLQEFYLGKYPVTQEQYQAIMGNNPSEFKDNPKNSVEQVSWDDAQEFCQKLSEKTGRKYRLPSEAEWEYACRAGTQTRYYFGDDEKQLGEYAWYSKNSGSKTHPVGQKKPNNWRLLDMHGNLWEWCEDGWHENYENAPTNGSSWNENYSQTNLRPLRGGSWVNYPRNCRSAFRDVFDADNCDYDIGFRLAVSIL
jgi:formylglycine-generating enzyme required for sulfatase activity